MSGSTDYYYYNGQQRPWNAANQPAATAADSRYAHPAYPGAPPAVHIPMPAEMMSAKKYNNEAEDESESGGPYKRTWKDTAKLVLYLIAVALLLLILVGIVVAAIAMLFDDDRALGRALHGWKGWRSGGGGSSGGNAMSTNGDGNRGD